MSDVIAALDDALSQTGEQIILRRIVGAAPNQVNIDVVCRASVTAASVQQIAAGIPATELNVILSPTQINEAQWPGGTLPQVPPFKVDQRVPRESGSDQAIIRGRLYVIRFAKPFFIGDELVRIEMRAGALA